jgi:hypothetical protein
MACRASVSATIVAAAGGIPDVVLLIISMLVIVDTV